MDIIEIFIIISFLIGSLTGVFCWEIFLRKHYIKKKK